MTATPTVGNIDAHTKERPRIRAADHGEAVEAKICALSANAQVREEGQTGKGLADAIRARFAPFGDIVLEDHQDSPAGEPLLFASDDLPTDLETAILGGSECR